MVSTEQIGAYRVTQVIATGRTSCVLAARSQGPAGFTQPVALKVLLDDAARSHELQRDFAQEARAAARVYHPHLVQVHGLVEQRDRNVLVMELVRGWSLRSLAATLALTQRVAAADVVAALVRDAALGAHALHEAGVLHRNLSPDNLMVSAVGCVKIVDFGAASLELLERVRPQSRPAFDPDYAAPEAALGLRVDRPCDVYSLGVVLHELCTGALPATGGGGPRVRGASGAHPQVQVDALPDGLGAVIERALRYGATDRFASAADLAEALDDVAEHHRWRASPARIGEYLAGIFATRAAAARATAAAQRAGQDAGAAAPQRQLSAAAQPASRAPVASPASSRPIEEWQ